MKSAALDYYSVILLACQKKRKLTGRRGKQDKLIKIYNAHYLNVERPNSGVPAASVSECCVPTKLLVRY